MDYTSVDLVATALGDGSGFEADPYAEVVVDAANAWVTRKRDQAGYRDDLESPGADVSQGATLYAVALWRERGATDGFPSFEDLSSFAPTGGSMGQIKRLLGIGRPAVDNPVPELAALRVSRRMVRRLWWARRL